LFQFSELAPARGSSGRVHLPRFVLLPRPSPSHPNPPWRQGSLPNHLVQRCNSGPVPRFAYSFGPTETFRPSERASFPAAALAFPSATPCWCFASQRRIAPSGEEYCPGTGRKQPRSCTSEERRNRLECRIPSFDLTLWCAMPVRRSGLPLWRAYRRAFLTCNLGPGLQKHEWLHDLVAEPPKSQMESSASVRAFRKECHQNHQVRKREQPLVRIDTCRFRCPRDKAQVAALGEIVHVLDANAGQARHFRIGEDLLARLHGNHGPSSSTPPHIGHTFFDALCSLSAAFFLSNSRSVLKAKNDLPSTFSLKSSKNSAFPHFPPPKTSSTKGDQSVRKSQDCSTFAISLLFSVGRLRSLASVLYGATREIRSFGTTDKCSAFLETRGACGTCSDRVPSFPQ